MKTSCVEKGCSGTGPKELYMTESGDKTPVEEVEKGNQCEQ